MNPPPIALWRRAILAALRVRVVYTDTADRIGGKPSIVICNHVSMLDGVLIALAAPHPMHFAVNVRHAREIPATSRLLAWMEARQLGTIIPLDGDSVFGLRALRDALLEGHSVCIFPEGRIAAGAPGEDKPGYLWLARKTGASIVRISIDGAQDSRFFAPRGTRMRPRIVLNF